MSQKVTITNGEPGVEYSLHALFDGYAFGDDGSAWSCWTFHRGKSNQWHRLKAAINAYGYPAVRIKTTDGRRRTVKVANLVLEAFCGPALKGMECCHLNGNRLDSRLCNLEWNTRQKNIVDRERHGNTARGERNGRSKLSEDQANEMRIRRSYGESLRQLSILFGVHYETARVICNGKSRASEHGTITISEYMRGERHYAAKHSRLQIIELRALHRTGRFSVEQLARAFNFTNHNCRQVIRRKIWKSV